MNEYKKDLIAAMAEAIGGTFGKPELDWTDEATAALAAHHEFVMDGRAS